MNAPDSVQKLPLDWRFIKLGEIASDESAFADGPFGSNLKTEHYVPSGARVVRLQNIGSGKFLDFDKAFISLENFEKLKRHGVQPGDIVVAALGDGARPAGRACLVPENFGPGLVKADCFRVRLPNSAAFPPYIVFAMNSPIFLRQVADRMRGATRPRMTLGILKDIAIPLPPLAEQKRIAAILNEQMAAAEKARAMTSDQATEVERLNVAYFRQAFQGIIPLAALAADQSPAPTGWRWHMLGDIARLESGHTPSRSRPDWWGGEIAWLALPDIRHLDGQVATQTAECTNELGIANSSARLLPERTVCLSRTASVGYVTILGKTMATSQDFVNWVCGPKLDPQFLMHLLRASRTYVRSLSSGAIHKTVYMPTVKAFRVCIPEIVEQRRIAGKLGEQLKNVAELYEKISQTKQSLEILPATLLCRAFSGAL